MPEEEQKEDQKLVEELAVFLKEQCLDKLIKQFEIVEGCPTDSEALEGTFHQHGINIRYLGKLAEKVKESKSHYIKTTLEKEVVLRCFKHIMNEQIRDSNETYLSSVIAHLFNLLLAPFPFLKEWDEGKIEFVDNTI